MPLDLGHGIVRISSFTGRELREVLRRPGVIVSLLLGPFLIMLLFGLGYTGYRDPLTTELVIPSNAGLPRDTDYYAELAPGQLEVVRISEDVEAAEARLKAREIDLLVVAPEDAAAELRAGRQSTLLVAWNQVDPVADALAAFATSILVSNVNSLIIEEAAAAGLAIAEGEAGPAVPDVPAEIVARPLRAETENVAPIAPRVPDFFGPAVLALVAQHVAVTLAALSLIRERLGGQMDRYRVAPVSAVELLAGKYLAYAVMGIIATAVVAGTLTGIIGVPMLGRWPTFAGILLLLTFAALGIGVLISLVADSERQAVQLAMLVLLASIFLSGFVYPVAEFRGWMQLVAYALPVTHGISSLQDTMLRGEVRDLWMIGVLAVIGIGLFVVCSVPDATGPTRAT